MKILVTGGAGFIWSAVVRLAIERGHWLLTSMHSHAAGLENLSSFSDNPNYSLNMQTLETAALDLYLKIISQMR